MNILMDLDFVNKVKKMPNIPTLQHSIIPSGA